MITVECLVCRTVTDYIGTVHDMIDVVCPACHVRERLVATPLNVEPPDDDYAMPQDQPNCARP